MSTILQAGYRIVVSSCEQRARELRTAERKCRHAYPKPGPLTRDCHRLADAHAAAAKIYEDLLETYRAEGER